MINTKHTSTIILSVLLVLFGIVARLLPHPANVAPMAAIALFGGIYLGKKYAIIVPFVTLFISDLLIGFYNWKTMVAVYISFLLSVGIGYWIGKNKSFARTVGGVLTSSILFFLITNAAVWAFDKMYPFTFSGLIQSYTMAIPFFRNSVIGDFLYTGILIGTAEGLLLLARKMQKSKTVSA